MFRKFVTNMSSSDQLATDKLFFFTFVSSPLQFGKHFMQFYLEVCLKVFRKDKSYLEEARALRKQVLNNSIKIVKSRNRCRTEYKQLQIIAMIHVCTGFVL